MEFQRKACSQFKRQYGIALCFVLLCLFVVKHRPFDCVRWRFLAKLPGSYDVVSELIVHKDAGCKALR